MGYLTLVLGGVSGIRRKDASRVRTDDLFDQYSRRLMVKVFVMCATFLGVKYFDTKVNCIIPNLNGAKAYIGPACWIQGFFVFEPLRTRLDESGYYGIPSNIDFDGTNALGALCSVSNKFLGTSEGCTPMEKTFYLQYQYFPFYLAALALIFYAPYIVFKMGNSDLDALFTEMNGTPDANKIAATYFDPDYQVNSISKMKLRVVTSLLTKVLYFVANILALFGTDSILNGNYLRFGMHYLSWLLLPNAASHEHDLSLRAVPKPGNVLLPAMGFCDIHEATHDVRNTHINTHRFICEISSHVLYQYVLTALWFFLVVGVVVSAVGLIKSAGGYAYSLALLCNKQSLRKWTLREIEYFEVIRKNNKELYKQVLRALPNNRSIENNNETSKL